jgi:hypothetical protein
MRVLVACEYSGRVRDAFISRGHDAVSCDILPTEVDGPHHEGDVLDLLDRLREAGELPQLLVAHPPCTFMANSGAKWLYKGGRAENGRDETRWTAMREAAEFFRTLLHYPGIPMVAVENPVMLGYAQQIIGSGPTQVIQPYQHSHGETKATGLWLRGLPKLTPTDVVEGREARVHRMPPSPDRWKERSRTYPGIAAAMAAQWGPLLDVEEGAA